MVTGALAIAPFAGVHFTFVFKVSTGHNVHKNRPAANAAIQKEMTIT
jgi:hypothetical protein